jgi:hypothetical protein
MFRLFDQLPTTRDEIEAHIAALSKTHGDPEHQALFGHLYGCLTILDDKCASLLSFNSIVIAVFAIFMTANITTAGFVILNIGMAGVLLSSLLLMSVVWIHWSTTADLKDTREHAVRLLAVRRSRTIRYRVAWWFSTLAIVVLTAFVLWRFVVRV